MMQGMMRILNKLRIKSQNEMNCQTSGMEICQALIALEMTIFIKKHSLLISKFKKIDHIYRHQKKRKPSIIIKVCLFR